MEHLTACGRDGMLLLQPDEHKQIVLNSLAFLVRDQRIWLYGYVILEDEIHLLWEKQPAWEARDIRQMLLKFTAQQIKAHMRRNRNPSMRAELERYRCSRHDRHFHFWQPHATDKQICTLEAAAEVLQHMHDAPGVSGLCAPGATYPFSSAAFYQQGEDPWQILTHYHNNDHLT